MPPMLFVSAALMVTKHSPATDRNCSSEPSAKRRPIERLSAAEVATRLVNEGPASNNDWPEESTQLSEIAPGGSSHTPGGVRDPNEMVALIPPVTAAEALPADTVASSVEPGVDADEVDPPSDGA